MGWEKGESADERRMRENAERAMILGQQISLDLMPEGPHIMRAVLIQLIALWLAAQTEPNDINRHIDWGKKLNKLNNNVLAGAEHYFKQIVESEREEGVDSWPPQL